MIKEIKSYIAAIISSVIVITFIYLAFTSPVGQAFLMAISVVGLGGWAINHLMNEIEW